MGAVQFDSDIEIVIHLEPWQDGKFYDRLGLEGDTYTILGVQLPYVTIPVRPGRNLAGIVEIAAMKNLKVVLALGGVAHNALLGTLGYPKSAFKFAHGARHELFRHNLILLDSYHTSRYNVNTGVLTEEMFEDVVRQAVKELGRNA